MAWTPTQQHGPEGAYGFGEAHERSGSTARGWLEDGHTCVLVLFVPVLGERQVEVGWRALLPGQFNREAQSGWKINLPVAAHLVDRWQALEGGIGAPRCVEATSPERVRAMLSQETEEPRLRDRGRGGFRGLAERDRQLPDRYLQSLALWAQIVQADAEQSSCVTNLRAPPGAEHEELDEELVPNERVLVKQLNESVRKDIVRDVYARQSVGKLPMCRELPSQSAKLKAGEASQLLFQ